MPLRSVPCADVLGSCILVNVVYYENPGEFWVILSKNESVLRSLQERMQLYCKETPLSFTNWHRGEYCCAQSTIDSVWFRGLILNDPYDGTCDVLLIDNGRTEKLTLNRLRKLKPEFYDIPRLALFCGLQSVRPADLQDVRVWSPKSIIACRDMLAPIYPLQCTFNAIVDNDCKKLYDSDLIHYEVVLVDLERMINPAVYLVQHGFAWINDHQKIEAPNCFFDMLSNAYPIQCLSNTTWDISISTFRKLDDFYVQLCIRSDELQMLKTQIMQDVSKTMIMTSPSNEVGSACLAPYSDGKYYRAIFLESKLDACQVFYVDYGNTANIVRTSCLPVLNHLKVTNVFAHKCSLRGIQMMDSNDPTESLMICERIQSEIHKLNSSKASCTFHEQNLGVYDVTIHFGSQNFAEHLQSLGLVRYFDRSQLPSGNLLAHQNEKMRAPRSITVNNRSTIVNNNKFISPTLTIQPGMYEAVSVMTIQSPQEFYVWLTKLTAENQSLCNSLNSLYKSVRQANLSVNELTLSCAVVVKYKNVFYRASVREICESHVIARLVDYGNIVKVFPNDIFECTTDFLLPLSQGIACTLHGFDELVVNEFVTKQMEELCLNKEHFAKILGINGRQYVEVILFIPDRSNNYINVNDALLQAMKQDKRPQSLPVGDPLSSNLKLGEHAQLPGHMKDSMEKARRPSLIRQSERVQNRHTDRFELSSHQHVTSDTTDSLKKDQLHMDEIYDDDENVTFSSRGSYPRQRSSGSRRGAHLHDRSDYLTDSAVRDVDNSEQVTLQKSNDCYNRDIQHSRPDCRRRFSNNKNTFGRSEQNEYSNQIRDTYGNAGSFNPSNNDQRYRRAAYDNKFNRGGGYSFRSADNVDVKSFDSNHAELDLKSTNFSSRYYNADFNADRRGRYSRGRGNYDQVLHYEDKRNYRNDADNWGTETDHGTRNYRDRNDTDKSFGDGGRGNRYSRGRGDSYNSERGGRYIRGRGDFGSRNSERGGRYARGRENDRFSTERGGRHFGGRGRPDERFSRKDTTTSLDGDRESFKNENDTFDSGVRNQFYSRESFTGSNRNFTGSNRGGRRGNRDSSNRGTRGPYMNETAGTEECLLNMSQSWNDIESTSSDTVSSSDDKMKAASGPAVSSECTSIVNDGENLSNHVAIHFQVSSIRSAIKYAVNITAVKCDCDKNVAASLLNCSVNQLEKNEDFWCFGSHSNIDHQSERDVTIFGIADNGFVSNEIDISKKSLYTGLLDTEKNFLRSEDLCYVLVDAGLTRYEIGSLPMLDVPSEPVTVITLQLASFPHVSLPIMDDLRRQLNIEMEEIQARNYYLPVEIRVGIYVISNVNESLQRSIVISIDDKLNVATVFQLDLGSYEFDVPYKKLYALTEALWNIPVLALRCCNIKCDDIESKIIKAKFLNNYSPYVLADCVDMINDADSQRTVDDSLIWPGDIVYALKHKDDDKIVIRLANANVPSFLPPESDIADEAVTQRFALVRYNSFWYRAEKVDDDDAYNLIDYGVYFVHLSLFEKIMPLPMEYMKFARLSKCIQKPKNFDNSLFHRKLVVEILDFASFNIRLHVFNSNEILVIEEITQSRLVILNSPFFKDFSNLLMLFSTAISSYLTTEECEFCNRLFKGAEFDQLLLNECINYIQHFVNNQNTNSELADEIKNIIKAYRGSAIKQDAQLSNIFAVNDMRCQFINDHKLECIDTGEVINNEAEDFFELPNLIQRIPVLRNRDKGVYADNITSIDSIEKNENDAIDNIENFKSLITTRNDTNESHSLIEHFKNTISFENTASTKSLSSDRCDNVASDRCDNVASEISVILENILKNVNT